MTRSSACRGLALALLLVATGSAPARGGGVALAWDHCHGEGTGRSIQSFACDTNVGSQRLVGSFSPDVTIANVTGLEMVLDVQRTDCLGVCDPPPPPGPLPQWWTFLEPSACRQTSLSFSAAPDPANGTCRPWVGAPGGYLVSYRVNATDPSRARLLAISVVPAPGADVLSMVDEYDAFTLTIGHQKTVGDGRCDGCNEVVVLRLSSVSLVTDGHVADQWLTRPLDGVDANVVAWRPAAVPVRRSTWTALRSLFR